MPMRSPLRRAVSAGRRAIQELLFQPQVWTASRCALPGFLIIGAQKAGTTSLYDELTQHPQIESARRKEVQYFTLHHHRGPAWYRAHFPVLPAGHITGEASPYYLFHPQVPASVHALLPDVKIIVMLRDPVARAWSHYYHARKLGLEDMDFEAAIDAEADRLAHDAPLIASGRTAQAVHHREHSYIARGRYAEQLQRWLELFPRQQMHIIRSEDYFADGATVLMHVLAFLDVEPWTPPARAWSKRGGYAQAMPTPVQQRLRDLFAPHNARLEQMLGKPMHWDD